MSMTLDSERNAFELWVQTISGWKACRARNKPMHLRQNSDGSYNDFRVNDRWCAWKARAHLAQPAQSVDVQWVETSPAESGWYWHWDGESYRMHFVFTRPGHAYLCTEGEPYGPGQKRNFQAVQRMGGKWSSRVEPPTLTAALQEKGNG